ncbi:hypothetical protein OG742_18860 [Streptomyces sp. NBC_00828]|uniref:hypothetical protein n=1 Tax=Streptomyces sp. NBC_00828 TaxID=2903678 RepID=UPI003869A954
MGEPRQSSSGAGAGAVLRKLAPPPALVGFLLLLVLIFAVSYTVGAAAGPVAPGIHGTDPGAGTSGGGDGTVGGTGHGHGADG